jgi:hypothetical protein
LMSRGNHCLEVLPPYEDHVWFEDWWMVLTPKIGTGESLICRPNLVKKSRPAKEDFFRRFDRDACSRQFASVWQKDCLR